MEGGQVLLLGGDKEAEAWVKERALRVLAGKSNDVAAEIRRSATRRDLSPRQRKGADQCANYLLRKRPYLRYVAKDESSGSPEQLGRARNRSRSPARGEKFQFEGGSDSDGVCIETSSEPVPTRSC